MKGKIKDIFYSNGKMVSNRLSESYISKHNLQPIVISIISNTKFLPEDYPLSIRIKCLLSDTKSHPMCLCGQPVKADNSFHPTCGNRSCSSKQSFLSNVKNNGIHNLQSTNSRKHSISNAHTQKAKEKRKNTMESRYGSGNWANREKSKQTCLERYGSQHHSQKEMVEAGLLEKFNNRDSFIDLMNSNGTNPQIVASNLKMNPSTLHNYMKKYDLGSLFFHSRGSKSESELVSFIRSVYKETIETSKKGLLSNNRMEIDVFLPSLNIAFEFNGLYWHSERAGRDKNYHLNKTTELQRQGIQLFHIWECDWTIHKDIWKNRISSLLGLNETIYARKCGCVDLISVAKKDFLNEFHLQGNDRSKHAVGLMFENELVCVMTFQVNVGIVTLSRFASNEKNVVGGFNKLLSYASKKFSFTKIISFANLTYSSGNLYEKTGWTKVKQNPPTYWYTKSYTEMIHKRSFQKKFIEKNMNFDPSLTEWENMKANGYDRIWDCGTIRYEIDVSQ